MLGFGFLFISLSDHSKKMRKIFFYAFLIASVVHLVACFTTAKEVQDITKPYFEVLSLNVALDRQIRLL